jgi:hypothetical protein
MRPSFLAVLVLCLLFESVAVRAQTAPTVAGDDLGPDAAVPDEYRHVVAEGVSEFAAGHWAEARAAFLHGHALWPSARTLRSLGMTSFELRAYARAATELQSALDDVRRPLSAEQRAHVIALLAQTKAFVGHYRVRLSPASAELLVDGTPRPQAEASALVLETGRHELLARAPGYEVMRRTLDVQGREDEELALELQPTPASSHAPPLVAIEPSSPSPAQATPRAAAAAAGGGRLWTWVAGGAAIALGAASTALWLHARSRYDAIDAKCSRLQCERGQLDESSFTTPELAHQITFGLALAAGAGAIALFVLEGEPERAEASSTRVTLGAAGLAVHSSF